MFETRDVFVFALEAGVAVAVLLFIWRWGRTNNRFAVGGAATALGVLVWNLTLNATDGYGFARNVNRLVNVSWQDAGTGIIVYCVTSLIFGWAVEPQEQAQRVMRASTLAGVTAMVLDVFLL